VANRIQAATRREAALIVAEGVATPDQVDQLVKDCFRWPMGPFEMQSTVSLD
jgi:3-hydroxybutyryl-CoA dehydrogenase